MHADARPLGKGIPPQKSFSPLWCAMSIVKATAAKAEAKASQGATVSEVTINFGRSSRDREFLLKLNSSELEWNNDEFVAKLIKAAFEKCVYRSKEGQEAMPEDGGVVDASTFTAAILALVWQGEARPSKEDVACAKEWLKHHKADDLVAAISKKYGWHVTPDENGVARHHMLKRLKEAEEADKSKMEDI